VLQVRGIPPGHWLRLMNSGADSFSYRETFFDDGWDRTAQMRPAVKRLLLNRFSQSRVARAHT